MSWTQVLLSSVLLAFLASSRPVSAQPLPPIHTVFVVVFENTSWSEIKNSTNAPYINGTLLPMASHCEFYHNVPGMHPSLPNYLWIEAGTNFGIFDNNEPAEDHQNTTNHLSTILNAAGISWKSYQENISPTNLPLVTCCGYSARHNPFLYFDDVTGTNNPTYPYGLAHIRPFSELAGDLATNHVAQYNFITPSDCDDMHSPCNPLYDRILQGDVWLSNLVATITSSAAFTNGGALFITWDETDDDMNPTIPMIVLSPYARGGGYSNTNYYDHSSLLRTLQDIFDARPLLGAAANAPNLGDLFMQFGFTSIEKLPSGAMHLALSGLTAGRTNIVQSSLDLTNWTPVSTNVAPGNIMSVTDYGATNHARGFYRFVELR